MTRPAAGGGRWVDVAPERLQRFLDGFGERHGQVSITCTPDVVTVAADDGARLECSVPFPPLGVTTGTAYGGLPAHAAADRRVGVVLVRRGGFAVGVFDGARLLASKVGGRHVQGRTAAGGWSQQRFARRRDQQARSAWAVAADTVASVLLPEVDALDAVIAGGDRHSCDEVLADPRLRPLAPLLESRRLDVPDPRQRVLVATPAAFRAVRVRIVDAATSGAQKSGSL